MLGFDQQANDSQSAHLESSMREVLAIEPLAVALQSRRDDERVIPRHAVSVCDPQTK